MLKEYGNLLDEGIQITEDLLTFAKANGYKISLRTGHYHSKRSPSFNPKDFNRRFGAKLGDNVELIQAVHKLYTAGKCHLPSFYEVLGFTDYEAINKAFKKNGLRVLSIKETRHTYKEIMDKRVKDTLNANYGVDNPMHSNIIKQKLKNTCMERFGVDNPMKTEEIKEKVKKTTTERHGGYTFQVPKLREKAKQTQIERYGEVQNYSSSQHRAKADKTMTKKYGVANPSNSPELCKKRKQTMMQRFGETTPLKNEEIKQKIFETNFRKRGTHNPKLNAENGQEHYERYQQLQDFRKAKAMGILDKEGCQRWILRSGWSESKELDLLKELCDKESKEFTTELKISSLLDDLKVPFIKKAKKAHGVRNKNNQWIELDFWFPELRLGIEINGLAYHSVNESAKGNPKEKSFHFEKFFAFHSSGIKMISFTDQDLNLRWNSVVNIIKHHLKLEDIEDSTLVDFPDLYRSFNYGLFDYEFPENPQFEDYCEAKFIEGWEYWDCGAIREPKEI